MTQLQILRALLQQGCTVTMSRRAEGYHIAVEGESKAGTPYTWEAEIPGWTRPSTRWRCSWGC